MKLAAAERLAFPPADFLGPDAVETPGHTVISHHPARPVDIIWAGDPKIEHVDRAVSAARDALTEWSRAPFERRAEALLTVRDLLAERKEQFAELIALETGKALWDARGEAGILASKIDITLDDSANSGRSRVAPYDVDISDTRKGLCRFRPHGVAAVIGPFNFPAHLPNGHIAPALLAGGTVVFKPSDKTPAVGQLLAETYREALASAGVPLGVFNLVQGHADIAQALTMHEGVDAILFTGSWPVGRKILEANLDSPSRLVALELGGNNPAVVMDDADLAQSVVECLRCAYISTGQRCTCTRRIILHEKIADRFLDAFLKAARTITVGDPFDDTQPFMGPLIREEAQQSALSFYENAVSMGAEGLLEPHAQEVLGCEGGHFITPALLRVDGFTKSEEGPGCDLEVFAPLARISVVKSFDEALQQANATRYGLASSIFTKNQQHTDAFLAGARAGCVNVNAGTAGASSKLPFGGLGLSGNHRPAGAFALDYCAYPVASMVEQGDAKIVPTGMEWDDEWAR